MSEGVKAEPSAAERRRPQAKSLANLRPWPKGTSGNPSGQKPRARLMKLARRHTRTAVRVLLSLAQSAKDEEVRRKAAVALLHEGWGPPPTSQELVRPQQPTAPLVSLNFGAQPGQPLTPEQAYRMMVSGELELDPAHPAFAARPPIEASAVNQRSARAERPPQGVQPAGGQALGDSASPAQPCAAAVGAASEPLSSGEHSPVATTAAAESEPPAAPALCGRPHPQNQRLTCRLGAGHRAMHDSGTGVMWS
jgi:hypothetical protein